MMKIEDQGFKIYYDNPSRTIYFQGVIRLWDPNEYLKIRQFMLDICELNNEQIDIDMTELEFLNSSGISMLCKFVFEVKKTNSCRIQFIGRQDILWQTKSLGNLKKIWDQLSLEFR